MKTLKGRTALAAALLAGVGIALVTTLQSNLSQRSVITSTVSQHQTATARAAADLDVRMRRAKGAISEFASNIPGNQLDNRGMLQQYLSSRVGLQQAFESIAVYAPDGHLMASRPLMSPITLAGEAWFQAALKQNATIGEPVPSRMSGDPVVPIAYRVYDEAGEFRGLAVGMLLVNHDNLVTTGSNDAARGHLIVIGRSGRIVLHVQSRLIGRSMELLGPQADAIRSAMADPSVPFEGPGDEGQRSLYAVSPVPSAGWSLVGVVSNEEAYASLGRLSRQMLLAGAALALLLFPAMWLLVALMLKPLDTLRREMRRVKEGAEHVPQAVIVAGTEEIRQVAMEFEDMAAARREAEQELQQEKERAEVTLQSIGDAVVATDVEGRITTFNVAAEKLTGCRAFDAIGRPFSSVVRLSAESDGEQLPDPALQAIEARRASSTSHAVLRDRQGRLVPIDNSVAPIIHASSGEVQGAVVVFRDVAAERAAAQELSWRASHDAMTGLVNRAAYELALNEMFETTRSGAQHSVLMIDLDEFKIVNDTCGHAAGDELLKQLAALFVRFARKSDLVARLGGDEFAVLMYQCESDHAMRVAEKLRQAVADWRFQWEGQTFRVGASIGLVLADRSFASAAELQKAADMACYMAKRTGRNRISVHASEDTAVESMRAQMQLVSRVQEAIDDNRLRLYAQTIVAGDPAHDHGAHFEVLVRMIDETGKLVPPGDFLGAAERYGLMDQLDRWVLDHAMAACARRFGPDRWHELDMAAVNISATTFRDPSIGDYVADALKRHAMPADRLCLEITETAAVEGLDVLRSLLTRIRSLGVRVALDDFGVGMTSLSQLRDIAVDMLKFDRSFITHIDTDPVNSEMVDAVQRIAGRLGMRTVAEGVENRAELTHLQRLGVHYLQGYLLARPVPIEEVLAEGRDVVRLPAERVSV